MLCDGPYSMECASLWIWINPLLIYHFVSCWILFAMRHQKPEFLLALKPGTAGFGWVWVPAMWVRIPHWVLAWFRSQHMDLSPNLWEMVSHQLNGHEFEQTQGDSERQGSLACCSSWGCKELEATSRLNNNGGYWSVFSDMQCKVIIIHTHIYIHISK